jgi:hypothetical protein
VAQLISRASEEVSFLLTFCLRKTTFESNGSIGMVCDWQSLQSVSSSDMNIRLLDMGHLSGGL